MEVESIGCDGRELREFVLVVSSAGEIDVPGERICSVFRDGVAEGSGGLGLDSRPQFRHFAGVVVFVEEEEGEEGEMSQPRREDDDREMYENCFKPGSRCKTPSPAGEG